MDTSVLEVLKNLNLYSKNFLRCQEKGDVCVFKCLSANLALQEFFKAINFRFTRTTKYQQTRNLHSFAVCSDVCGQ